MALVSLYSRYYRQSLPPRPTKPFMATDLLNPLQANVGYYGLLRLLLMALTSPLFLQLVWSYSDLYSEGISRPPKFPIYLFRILPRSKTPAELQQAHHLRLLQCCLPIYEQGWPLRCKFRGSIPSSFRFAVWYFLSLGSAQIVADLNARFSLILVVSLWISRTLTDWINRA